MTANQLFDSFCVKSGSLKDLLLGATGKDYAGVLVALLSVVDARRLSVTYAMGEGRTPSFSQWYETRLRAQSILESLGVPSGDARLREEIVAEFAANERQKALAAAILSDRGTKIVSERHTFLYSRASAEEIEALKRQDADALRALIREEGIAG